MNNVHVPVYFQLCALPVENVPSLHSLPGDHVLDRAVREDRVPHVDIADLSNETLFGVKVTHVNVRILSEDNLAPGTDGVALPVKFGQAFLPVQEEGRRARTGVPGDTQVGLHGAGLRDSEHNAVSTHVEGQSKHTHIDLIHLIKK